MNEVTNGVPKKPSAPAAIDERDRMLLGLLGKDASLSYAQLGKEIALSAPATHERVKRLKRAGVIQSTTVDLDPKKIGRPLLAFVLVDTDGWSADGDLVKMEHESAVEEVHAVAGETCLILKVRCEDAQALTDFLERLYNISGVRRTRSHIVLSTFLERKPQLSAT